MARPDCRGANESCPVAAPVLGVSALLTGQQDGALAELTTGAARGNMAGAGEADERSSGAARNGKTLSSRPSHRRDAAEIDLTNAGQASGDCRRQ
jgi:hypothetical protein